MKKIVTVILTVCVLTISLAMSFFLCSCEKYQYKYEYSEEELEKMLYKKAISRFSSGQGLMRIYMVVNGIGMDFIEDDIDVSIIKAFDGKPDFFMLEFKPSPVYICGYIYNGEFYYTWRKFPEVGVSLYTENNIEKENRYMDQYMGEYALIYGRMTSLYNGNIVSESIFAEHIDRSRFRIRIITENTNHDETYTKI